MAFSESTKREAKRRAHYMCVICKAPYFADVHHIIPQAVGGSDDLENAATLCPSCHDLLGGNPDKRKWVREARDFHWELCERRETHPSMTATFEKFERLEEQLKSHGAETGTALSEIKQMIRELLTERLEAVNTAHSIAEVADATDNLALAVGSYRSRRKSRQRGSVVMRSGEDMTSASISKVSPMHSELSWEPRSDVRAYFNGDGTATTFVRRNQDDRRRDILIDFEVVEEHD